MTLKHKTAVVAIIGRPNVGKSTLFNRITHESRAIVDSESGVTRDRHYCQTDWNGRSFFLMDTGGYVPDSNKEYEIAIREQVEMGIEEADVVVFLADVQTGVTDTDVQLARLFLNRGVPFILAVNKVDDAQKEMETGEFYSLGLGDPLPVSATGGRNIGELLDLIVSHLPEGGGFTEPDDTIQLAIIGRPNVGKSSLVNSLLGQERMIVTPLAGTTRDSTDSPYRFQKRNMNLIDTAGLRRRTRVKESIEFYASLRTTKAITRCDLAILLIEPEQRLTSQDITVLHKAVEMKKGIIIAVNKWDLVEKDTGTTGIFRKSIYDQLPNLSYVPLEFISATNRQRIHQLMKRVLKVETARDLMIPREQLEAYLEPIIATTPPPSRKGRFVNFDRIYQHRVRPTVFRFITRFPDLVDTSWQRFAERKIREAFDFSGVPLRLEFLNRRQERDRK